MTDGSSAEDAQTAAPPLTTAAGARPARWHPFDHAPLLLLLNMSFWAGNGVIGKWVSLGNELPPVALAFWRWAGALCLILPLAWRYLRRDWPAIRARRWVVLFLSLTGITLYNTLVYWSQRHTATVNMFILNAAIPLFIPALSWLLFRERVGSRQLASILLALAGAITLVTRGRPDTLLQLSFNRGDLVILLAMLCYAIYSACLRLRPQIHPLSFLAVTFGAGLLLLLPAYGLEILWVGGLHLTGKTMAALGYVMVFPSFLAYLCFNRAVELIGANRASVYFYLIPLIGVALTVLIFHEPLHGYHAAGALLIVAGILISSLRRPVTRGAARDAGA